MFAAQHSIFKTRFSQDSKETTLCLFCAFVFNSPVSEMGIDH